MKKPRSKISQSPQEIRDRINEKFDEGATLQQVADLFENLTGQRISHKAAESYYHGEYQLHKIQTAKVYAQRIASAVGSTGELSQGFDAALQQRAFEVLTNPNASVGDVKAIGNLLLDTRRYHISKEALALELQKFKTALQDKIDAGLEELGRQAKGNKAALSLLKQFAELVRGELKPA